MSDKDETKVEEILGALEPTNSETDRLQIDSIKTMNIVKIINSQLEKTNEKNSLKSLTIRKIQEAIEQGDSEVSFVALIKLIEILDKSDNDLTLGLFGGIAEVMKGNNQTAENLHDKEEKENKAANISFTKEDFHKFKKVIDIFSKLEESEFEGK